MAGYQWLVENPRILHRDISLRNLMLRKKGDKVYGILNDFDLAVYEDRTLPSSKQRTGTRPYMAVDLLEKKASKHMYRHDLESMIWVFLKITLDYEDGEEIANAPLRGWQNLGDEAMAEKKSTFLIRRLPLLTKAYQPLAVWAARMREIVLDGYRAKSRYEDFAVYQPLDEPFDDMTLGGFISFSKFKEILDIS